MTSYSIARPPADEIIHVDIAHPEKNGDFFVHHILDVPTAAGDEYIDVLKITTPHLIDLRDFKNWSGHVVLNGRGFLVSKPTVPHYLLHDYGPLFARDRIRCPRTESTYRVEVNHILASPARQVKKILLLFPDFITCNAELTATTASSDDQKVPMQLRKLELDTRVKREGEMVVEEQVFCPGSFVLRVINAHRRIINLAQNRGDDDDLETAFAGMNV